MPIDTLLFLWVSDSNDDIACSEHMRSGLCGNRKCRQVHKPYSPLLSKSVGITYSEEHHCGNDVSCNEPKSSTLWDIPETEIDLVKFISTHDENILLYDHLNHNVWNEFKLDFEKKNVILGNNVSNSVIEESIDTYQKDNDQSNNSNTKNLNKNNNANFVLSCIPESLSEPNDNNFHNNNNNEDSNESHIPEITNTEDSDILKLNNLNLSSSSSSSLFTAVIISGFVSRIIVFLSDEDFTHLLLASK